ncbi:MAG: gp33 family protein [Candidatus Heimdallarchaeaceae archaeon]
MTQFLNEKLITQSELTHLSELVEKQLTYEDEIKNLEEELQAKKKQYNEVRQIEIPDFLKQFGISEIKLANGKKVTIKEDVSVTIKDAKAFYDFLRKRHDDAIIKNILEMESPPTELMDELMERGYLFSYNEKIHGQTLKAYFRTFLEVGEIPPDSVNVYTYSITKIK